MKDIQFTPEQKNVIEGIFSRIEKGELETTLGGYAGTGKTTIISELIKKFPNFAVCAPTGKAANVLRKKGISASTIHSLIYTPMLDELGRVMVDGAGSPIFQLNPGLSCKGIIVDESSMINKEIYEDLKSFNIPLVFVGDHGQLEPVGDTANLMINPDFVLEEIHRNAGEIAHFAEWIRKGNRPAAFAAKDKVHFLQKYEAKEYFTKVDQIICAYNKTRVFVNQIVRMNLGLDATDLPVVNDKVMCLRNDKKKGLFNGMQGVVTRAYPGSNKLEFSSNDTLFDVRYDKKQFYKEKYDFGHDRDAPAPFDYAYCITCHKAQGDQWPIVMVLEQRCKNWDHKRWAYTSASRAEEAVIWVEGY